MDTILLLKKLVTFRTTADRTIELAQAIAFIKKLLEKNGVWTQTLRLPAIQRPVLYACTQKTKKPDLLLVPHLDVVEGIITQFTPIQKGSWLYARGASDCKSNVAVVIKMLLAFTRSEKSIGAFFITDEEIGGPTTRLLLAKGFIGKRTLVLDGEMSVVFRQKGILNLRVAVKGKSAHGSQPWDGENANEKLMMVYSRIVKLFPATTAKNRWKETVNLGIMHGGDVINKVADQAEMRLNIRLTEKADYKKIVWKIRNTPGVDQVEILGYHPYFYVDPKSQAVQEFKRIMEASLGKKLSLESMHGATDVHNFAGYKTQLIVSGVGHGEEVHGPGERVFLPGMLSFEKALKEYIRQTT